MRKSWLLCVLLGTLAWGQAAPATPPPASRGIVGPTPGNMARPQAAPPQRPPAAPPDTSASVPADAAVITIVGVCPAQPKTAAAKGTTAKPATAAKTPAAKTPAADCKTIITKAEFEKLANALAPNLTPQLRKQLGGVLPQLIAMTSAAEKKGLDKTPEFKQKLKFARMQRARSCMRANFSFCLNSGVLSSPFSRPRTSHRDRVAARRPIAFATAASGSEPVPFGHFQIRPLGDDCLAIGCRSFRRRSLCSGRGLGRRSLGRGRLGLRGHAPTMVITAASAGTERTYPEAPQAAVVAARAVALPYCPELDRDDAPAGRWRRRWRSLCPGRFDRTHSSQLLRITLFLQGSVNQGLVVRNSKIQATNPSTTRSFCLAHRARSGGEIHMSGSPAISPSDLMRAEKRSAAGTSVLAAIVITSLKVVVEELPPGAWVFCRRRLRLHRLSAHVFLPVGVSDKPADADHQYGHGKVENFSAFVETGLLCDLRLDHLRSGIASLLSQDRH